MFDNIAPEYDKLNHLMSLDIDKTWRKRALTQIFKPNLTDDGGWRQRKWWSACLGYCLRDRRFFDCDSERDVAEGFWVSGSSSGSGS